MEWQIAILKTIQEFKNPVLDLFFEAVTMSAEELFFIVVAAWILWCHDKRMGYRIGITFLSSTALNPFLKNVFRFERPIGTEGIVSERVHTATGYSFPSGHTQGASAFWTGILLWYKKPLTSVLAIAMMLLVALSRLYLGVHWPSDIAGGLLIGVVWVGFGTWLYAVAERHGKPWLVGVLLLPGLIGYLFFNTNPEDNALTAGFGAAVGFYLGYLIEARWLRFKVRNRWYLQLLKLALGLAIVLGLKAGLKPLLPFTPFIADLIRYWLIGLWISAGAPALFKLLRLDGQA